MEGEGKEEMYVQLPKETYPITVFIQPGEPISQVLKKMRDSGLEFPFIVKPDIGMKGYLFRKINHETELEHYHSLCPVYYMMQQLAPWDMEVGVFYYRHPTSETGRISGFTIKEAPYVVGDGKSTLHELIINHRRADKMREEMERVHAERLQEVLPDGHFFQLSVIANRVRGGQLTNMTHAVTPAMNDLFDQLSRRGEFYFGRYDIKCASLEDMLEGRNFMILEYNGCGAGTNHMYHCGMSVWQAWGEVIHHWEMLYQISKYNHETGRSRYWPLMKGYRYLADARKYFDVVKAYEKKI